MKKKKKRSDAFEAIAISILFLVLTENFLYRKYLVHVLLITSWQLYNTYRNFKLSL